MSPRCSTVSVVAAALALVAVACGNESSQADTPIDGTARGIATPTSVASAQNIIEEWEATVEATADGDSEMPPDLMPVRLVRALDGDSGIAAGENQEIEFRLYGIDAPERDDVSRDALVRLIAEFGNDLFLEDVDVDIYGRRVVVLRTQDGSRLVNLEMIRRGYAHPYVVYGELEGAFGAEAEARAAQRGVWAPTPTATPKAGLTLRQEEVLASVRRGTSLTNERLWELTHAFIDEGGSRSYDDGHAVGYADSSSCDALLLLAERLMDSSHPALGDNILAVVVDYFGDRSAPAYAEGYLDGYKGGRGCTPWDNISPHAQFSATEEGRLEVHGNALAASSMYMWADQRVQQYLHRLFEPLNAQYVATAILNPSEGGPTFRDYIRPSLGGEGLFNRARWKSTFDYLQNTYNDPSDRLSGSQQVALDELHGQAFNLYTEAIQSCLVGLDARIFVGQEYSAARDSNPAISPWEFASQRPVPCSN